MAPKSILIVEPDYPIGCLMTTVLQPAGLEITTVQSLEQAASALNDSDFDVIITEALGQTDGYRFDPAFLERLRLLAPTTPIILSSLYPSTDDFHAGDYGLAEVLHKPFNIDELVTKVMKVLVC